MTNKSNRNSDENAFSPVLIAISFIIGLILLMFLLRFSRIAFLITLMLVLIISGGIYFYRWLKNERHLAEFAQSAEGKIQIQQELCKLNIEQLQIEMGDIRENINELKTQLRNAKNARQDARKESERLIAAFEKELELRNVKLEFYQSCLKKLQILKENHQLIKEMEAKQLRLKQLKESQYEELASMEELRSNLEYEERYLDTIETLSLRMLKSQSTDNAEALQLELQQMTKELRNP